MELTLFIKKSNHPASDRKKTIKSLESDSFSIKEIVFIDKFENIDYEGIQTDWYMILHDNEALDESLLESIPCLLEESKTKCFAFYKSLGNEKFSVCPRLFRKEIKISTKVLYPRNELEPIVNILNGFVVEH
jgi:hypothetical protein